MVAAGATRFRCRRGRARLEGAAAGARPGGLPVAVDGPMSSAIVVGSGPNGLAAAVTLAQAGVQVTVLEAAETIGGGTRTTELIRPGLLHDHCSAFHPMADGSEAFESFGLAEHGLRWCYPEIDLAHPLDGGSAGVMMRSIAETAAGLGADGRRWRALFGKPSERFDDLGEDINRPVAHLPRHPLLLARFGLPSALPAAALGRAFRTERGRALFAGVAAHAFAPFHWPMSSAVGMALISAGHHTGWPVAKGGSRAITDAMASALGAAGGIIETGAEVRALADLGPADAILFDLSPGAVAEICDGRLPDRVARAYRAYRHGPGVFKLDLAIGGGVPWINPDCRRAGTVHVGGDFGEIAEAERLINRGRMPERPFVVVGQQYLADPSRSDGETHPLWAYAHVPSGYTGDATEPILAQIERFAPGVRERVLEIAARTTPGFEKYNPNFVGGDIICGANTPIQLALRPRIAIDPYSCGTDGLYICSAATPPGAGVHGMCGYNAARSALRSLG